MTGVHLAQALLFVALAAAVGLFAAPAGYALGRTRQASGGRVLPAPAPLLSKPGRPRLLGALEVAALHGRHGRPLLDPRTYRDDQIARDPALQRLTRHPTRPAHVGEHRAPIGAAA